MSFSKKIEKLAEKAKVINDSNKAIIFYTVAGALDNDLYEFELATICKEFSKKVIQNEQNKRLN